MARQITKLRGEPLNQLVFLIEHIGYATLFASGDKLLCSILKKVPLYCRNAPSKTSRNIVSVENCLILNSKFKSTDERAAFPPSITRLEVEVAVTNWNNSQPRFLVNLVTLKMKIRSSTTGNDLLIPKSVTDLSLIGDYSHSDYVGLPDLMSLSITRGGKRSVRTDEPIDLSAFTKMGRFRTHEHQPYIYPPNLTDLSQRDRNFDPDTFLGELPNIVKFTGDLYTHKSGRYMYRISEVVDRDPQCESITSRFEKYKDARNCYRERTSSLNLQSFAALHQFAVFSLKVTQVVLDTYTTSNDDMLRLAETFPNLKKLTCKRNMSDDIDASIFPNLEWLEGDHNVTAFGSNLKYLKCRSVTWGTNDHEECPESVITSQKIVGRKYKPHEILLKAKYVSFFTNKSVALDAAKVLGRLGTKYDIKYQWGTKIAETDVLSSSARS